MFTRVASELTYRFTPVGLSEGDPLVSRIDLSGLSQSGSQQPQDQPDAMQVDSNVDFSSCEILFASWDIKDVNVIYAIVKDANHNIHLQRWEYKPVYMTASESFDWLVKLTKQSPTAETNFVCADFPPNDSFVSALHGRF